MFTFNRGGSWYRGVPAIVSILTFSVVAPPLQAQNDTKAKLPYNYIYMDFGGDIFSPQSSLFTLPAHLCGPAPCKEPLATKGGFSMAMGVRPIRYLQIDAVGVEVLGDFAGWGSPSQSYACVSGCTGTFSVSSSSHTALVTTGARLVFPLFREHLLVSAGGGFGWLKMTQKPVANGNVTLQDCVYCSSVGGHGPTEVAEVMYFPNPHLGIGFHVRNIQVNSAGGLTPLDAAIDLSHPGTTYKDRFLLIGGEISIRFGTRQ